MTTPLFSELDLSPEILQALTVMGFEAPTPIQHQCIPALREGRDVLGQAQTGTGKTAAFGIPALEHIDLENRNVQALVLCPTRELAIQITGELMKLGQFKKGIHIVPVYGGQPIDRQLKALKRATHIVVGTPGRVIDHLERRTLDISQLSMFVLDEADEMLNMGFREDIENISKYCLKKPQTVMFSATVSAPIRDIINRQMVDPLTIRIDRSVTTAPNIEQFIVDPLSQQTVETVATGYPFQQCPSRNGIVAVPKLYVAALLEQFDGFGGYPSGYNYLRHDRLTFWWSLLDQAVIQ